MVVTSREEVNLLLVLQYDVFKPYLEYRSEFSGAFAKFRKATIGFVMSVRPPGATLLPLDGF